MVTSTARANSSQSPGEDTKVNFSMANSTAKANSSTKMARCCRAAGKTTSLMERDSSKSTTIPPPFYMILGNACSTGIRVNSSMIFDILAC